MSSRTFHNGTLASPRIAQLLAFLKERGKQGATSIEISDVCCTPRSTSDVSELRANGIGVTCRHESTSEAGRRIYRYVLAEFETTGELHCEGKIVKAQNVRVLDAPKEQEFAFA